MRDASKNEVNKLMAQYREKRDSIAQHLSRIDTLNQVINATEEDMLVLKSRFAQSVKDRNSVGMQLLDRNDELCILYEKLNIQVDTLDKGQAELANREDEIRKFDIIKCDTKREVELLKTLKPKVANVQESMDKVQTELDNTRYTVLDLSSRMESPEDPKRSRYLKGKDPERNVLVEKIRAMEERLAEKEVRCLSNLMSRKKYWKRI
jgi:chromosome segregation ATPase